ncbi:MAG: ligase-associated DNA damage response endonuclease PdeM [Pseudomonadota bacterium]
MNVPSILLAGETLTPLPSGALWWGREGVLAVSDLHLGKSERIARRGGGMLPPYETEDTLNRLEAVVTEAAPQTLVLLGDSFDDLRAADAVKAAVTERLLGLAGGRRLIWIAGNHDPGPVDLPGSHMAEYRAGPLVFRHIAEAGASGEISGHYHPKMRLWLKGTHIARPCFLTDQARAILPAFGTYTGGLDVADPAYDRLFGPGACAWLTGRRVTCLPRFAEAAQRRRAG